jgi:hypothetical protein
LARKSEKERVAEWQGRIDSANKVYKKWEEKYHCKDLEQYYLGHQWSPEEEHDERGNRRYTINLVFPTIETQLPSQLFYHPTYSIRPEATLSDDPGEFAEARAQLQEMTLNAMVRDRRLHFKAETARALMESKFRFGMIEVGYSGNYSDNPDVGKPMLNEKDEEMRDSSGAAVLQPEQILRSEALYFKRIPACQFRVSVKAHNELERCDWVGYYEWQYPSDIKKNRRYRNTTGLKATGKLADENSASSYADADQENELRNMCKVWKIWDLRTKVRRDFTDGNEKFLLEEPMDEWEDGRPVVPFAPLVPLPINDEFYPLPVVYNWMSPQDELNETREMQKVHRRRFKRKFQMRDGGLIEGEMEKWETGGDGTIIKTALDQPIQPIQDAPLDPAIVRNIPLSKEDFREISGVSGEQRGIADADTATQANIISVESKIRETKAKDQIADWLGVIGTLALYFLRKRMTMPMWIQMNVDPSSPLAQLEVVRVGQLYQQIQAEDLDGVVTSITVDVESLAPINETAERQDFIQMLQIVGDPVRGPMILANETLLRKLCRTFHITSEKEIVSLRDFGVQALQMMMMAQQAQSGGGGAPSQGGQAAPGPTPDNNEIAGQIQKQLPA